MQLVLARPCNPSPPAGTPRNWCSLDCTPQSRRLPSEGVPGAVEDEVPQALGVAASTGMVRVCPSHSVNWSCWPQQHSTGRAWPCARHSTALAGCLRLGAVYEVGMRSSGSTAGWPATMSVTLLNSTKFPLTRCHGLPCNSTWRSPAGRPEERCRPRRRR